MSALDWLSSLSWKPTLRKLHPKLNWDFIPFIFLLLETMIKLIHHWFGICYVRLFFIALLRDIFLYIIGLWNYYNFCSEPVVDKLLAKQSVSEHNLLPDEACFNTTCPPGLSRGRAGQTSHLSVFSYKGSTFIIYKLCLRIWLLILTHI